jgi:hypothetical protein
MFCTILRDMKSDRETEILFRRLHLYDRLGRRAEGLIRTIQRVMKERFVNVSFGLQYWLLLTFDAVRIIERRLAEPEAGRYCRGRTFAA